MMWFYETNELGNETQTATKTEATHQLHWEWIAKKRTMEKNILWTPQEKEEHHFSSTWFSGVFFHVGGGFKDFGEDFLNFLQMSLAIQVHRGPFRFLILVFIGIHPQKVVTFGRQFSSTRLTKIRSRNHGLGGGFKYFACSPRNLGKIKPFWRACAYFSDGLTNHQQLEELPKAKEFGKPGNSAWPKVTFFWGWWVKTWPFHVFMVSENQQAVWRHLPCSADPAFSWLGRVKTQESVIGTPWVERWLFYVRSPVQSYGSLKSSMMMLSDDKWWYVIRDDRWC